MLQKKKKKMKTCMLTKEESKKLQLISMTKKLCVTEKNSY